MSSIFRIQKQAAMLSGIGTVLYDCCVRSCCAFTAQYENLQKCPFCSQDRFDAHGRARKHFAYLPLIPRLTRFFGSETFANLLDYPQQRHHSARTVADVFDGSHFKTLCTETVVVDGQPLPHRHFSEKRDIALGLSVDGFCPFKHTKQTCWPIILFNFNLPPDLRTLLNYILCVGVVPGPNQMKDLDSYLVPLIRELQRLAHGVRTYDCRTHELFALHAYLIMAFGDIPAVAKLMRMKGHNGKCPCRACNLTGVRIPNSSNKIHYLPLYRADQQYHPLRLPLRTHYQFMKHATQVATAAPTTAKKLAIKYGIKGVPVLASLSSVQFPGSFPYDFMHLIFENILPGLILLWTNKFTALKEDRTQPYHIPKTVWDAIGEATVEAGATIPSVFGCRPPNIAKSRSEFTAEAWCVWALFVGPVLLKRRFIHQEYYNHFIRLIRLVVICLRYEMTRKDIEEVRMGFALWVTDYERYA